MLVLTVPPASVCAAGSGPPTAFSTQVVRAPFGGGVRIGRGGPKKQFASAAHDVATPPQSALLVHTGFELLLMQCRPGPPPTVQVSRLPVFAPLSVDPLMFRIEVEPSGIAPPGTFVAPPPPK